ncbi:MAG: hypothetical protein CMB76_05700 [Euryarchaeota archaeon]|nr:hypothetical protein [Euryarchaeota archaeon]|tara:strand:+ start:14534 stop:15343 length:810 start_codon:yes stop_codon:yes gene_type:complete
MTYSIADYENRYANHIAEANRKGNYDTEKIIANAIRLSRVATRKDFEDFKETFKDYDHGLGHWKKWGGGNKRASGTTATRKAKIAAISKAVGDSADSVNVTQAPDINRNDYAHSSYDDGLGFRVNQFLAGINAKANDTQGKNMPSNPSIGYSNHSRTNSYNTHGVGTRSDGSKGTYGGPSVSAGTYGGISSNSSSPRLSRFAMSFSVPSNLRSLYTGAFNIAGGPDPNRGLNRGATYGRDGEKTSITTDSDFGIRMRNQVLADMARFKA